MLALIGSSITAYESFVKIGANRHFTSTSNFDNINSMSVNEGDIDKHSMHGDDDAMILGHTRKSKTLPG